MDGLSASSVAPPSSATVLLTVAVFSVLAALCGFALGLSWPL
jgi:hypothetical protein